MAAVSVISTLVRICLLVLLIVSMVVMTALRSREVIAEVGLGMLVLGVLITIAVAVKDQRDVWRQRKMERRQSGLAAVAELERRKHAGS